LALHPTFKLCRQGFIWIGAQDGLNRFDGYEFTTYRYDPNDPHSLSNNHVRDIIEDADGALWIATQGGGLNRFDPLTESFTRYPTSAGSGMLFSVFQDRAGALWVGGSPPLELESLDAAQVAAINAGALITPTFRHFDVAVAPEDDFRGGVQAIVEDADGALWLAADLALIRFLPAAGAAAMTAYAPHPQEKRLNAVALDAEGHLWVGGTTGLHKFNPITERFTSYDIDFEIDALYVDGDTLWIGGLGLYAFDLRTERVVQKYVHHKNDLTSLCGEVVTAIFKDAGGVLWIGTHDGVSTFDPRQQQFAHYRHAPDDPASLSDDQIQAIACAPDGAVWLATPQMIDRLDPTTGDVTHYDPLPGARPLPGQGVTALLRDHNGDIWIGAGDRVLRRDAATGDLEVYDALHARARPGPPPNLAAIVEDHNGNVWIAMTLVGLHHFDRSTGVFHTYLPNNQMDAMRADAPQTIITNRLSALYVDRDGNLWIGYQDGMLSRYDVETAAFTHYGFDSSAERGQLGWIQDIYAKDDVLWLATRSGLVRFDPSDATATSALRRYTEKDGLPAAYVQSILPEPGGRHLWLGTTKGLSRFDPRTETFYNFT
jgi:ligand-binding sensor domain-containing protein